MLTSHISLIFSKNLTASREEEEVNVDSIFKDNIITLTFYQIIQAN
jgi:hypothetical protein